MPRSRWGMAGLLGAFLFSSLGCSIEIPNEAAKAKKKKKGATAQNKTADGKTKAINVKHKPDSDPVEIKIPDPANNRIASSSGRSGGGMSSPGRETFGGGGGSAFPKISELIRETVDLGPTLVVWCLDVSESAFGTTRSMGSEILGLHEKVAAPVPGSAPKQLLSAVVSFSATPNLVTETPTSDRTKLKEAFDSLKADGEGSEATFAAVKMGLDKFVAYRTREPQHQVLFVIVTDEVGDDGALIDSMLPTFTKFSIPVYSIGRMAPFGRTGAGSTNNDGIAGINKPDSSKKNIVYGPESRDIEFVPLSFNSGGGGYGYGGGGYGGAEQYESGFGPFQLERICRKTGGAFLGSTFASSGGGSSMGWGSSGSSARVDPTVMQKYAPDYIGEAEYAALLEQSPARKALVEAAKLRMPQGLNAPNTRFDRRSDAALANGLNNAQKPAAALESDINRIYDILVKGEGDRAKITSPRWQASYDLAMGQITALKANVEGYNQMLASLKTKNTFTKEGSTIWVLEPDDRIPVNSQLDKLTDKARTYLGRVAKEHPKTPWGIIAEKELKKPIGWKWVEQ